MAEAILVLFAVFVLVPSVHIVVADEIELSIDCGLPDTYGASTDPETKNYYVPDGSYTDAGENHVVAAASQPGRVSPIQSLRSFPSGKWNCYALPTIANTTYLVRAQFAYGNYDGKNSSSVQFELHLGSNLWDTITATPEESSITKEAVFMAWAGWAPVCLVNTGGGTPFVSVVELRRLSGLYPPVSSDLWMSMYARRRMGTDVPLTRHPDDQHDRTWSGMTSPQWLNLSTQLDIIQPDSSFDVPLAILRTAVASASSNTSLTVVVPENKGYSSTDQYMVFLHLADFQSTKTRQFDIYVNNQQPWLSPTKSYSLLHDAAICVYSSETYSSSDGKHNITLVPTATSELPPMLNALEIYTLIDLDDASSTFSADFNAIMGIKHWYGVRKNWMGDPCFSSWDGVNCRNISDSLRITSLDLSSSNLTGEISQNFTLLAALENLDLSYNRLNGIIPDSIANLSSLHVLNLSGNDLSGPFPDYLCKNQTGLIFSYKSGGSQCNKRTNPSGKRATDIAVSVVVPVLVLAILGIGYFISRKKIVPNASTHDPARDPEFENVPRSGKRHGDHLKNNENRRFTYKELENITHNFERFIGHGGFGHVYYGSLENGTEIAVKMRSESSLHGLDEFVAEVQSLTKVHHRNLVSLVGYCWEEDHLALVYEYLCQGSLFDHLRGKNAVAETLNWETRVRVVLEAAQGLDYLHKGCNLPIIHRDVKTSNILLGRNLEAKLADFGLCKTYISDSQTHISATAAGSAGYMDPEYYHTGRLTESSDVYSFGVVLLEVATGKPPIVPGHGHIVQRVNQMINTGDDISSIADVRLEGAYDVNSMWKVVDTANNCTSATASQRPTMAAVVAQLKESLALEEARERDSSVRATLGGNISALLSTVGPSAR
ncbi:unnamed protein product [Urochloa decumbens]|uniref:non-specific serine/threonine protein kinase n=1 Tax=Urochloa decumbens TaxID=240449 RepID=A0ABC9EY11_9POAL